MSISRESEVLLRQYDLLITNVQYLDSYVPKIFSVYAAFCGLIIANSNEFSNESGLAVLFVIISTVTAYLMIFRISRLNELNVQSVTAIEKSIKGLEKLETMHSFFPQLWGQGLSTSRTVRIGMILLGIATCISLMT